MTENPEQGRSSIEDYPGEWGDTYWRPPPHLPYEVYEAVYEALRALRKAEEHELDKILWRLADCVNNGEAALGEKWSQVYAPEHYTKESMVKIRRTGEEFPPSERWSLAESGVSFWTHWEVRKLRRADRSRLLKRYSEDPDYSRDDLRDDVRALLKEMDAETQEGLFEESGAAELPQCPLCDGSGHVTEDRRTAYLMEEGLV